MPKYHIEKSITVQADSSTVFNTLADYGQWTSWSPWLIAEPTAVVTVSDDPRYVGSTYAWVGQITGEGKLTHSLPHESGNLRIH